MLAARGLVDLRVGSASTVKGTVQLLLPAVQHTHRNIVSELLRRGLHSWCGWMWLVRGDEPTPCCLRALQLLVLRAPLQGAPPAVKDQAGMRLLE